MSSSLVSSSNGQHFTTSTLLIRETYSLNTKPSIATAITPPKRNKLYLQASIRSSWLERESNCFHTNTQQN
nr:hypothetical protein Iba_chr03cCG13490 [Ipomoea batatas]GME13024.1 hypothetical protein Iba_scaffold14336CG0080 [Ipomoea batatas]